MDKTTDNYHPAAELHHLFISAPKISLWNTFLAASCSKNLQKLAQINSAQHLPSMYLFSYQCIKLIRTVCHCCVFGSFSGSYAQTTFRGWQ